MNNPTLEIVPTPASHGKTKVTVVYDGKVIATDELKIGNAKARKAFIDGLIDASPGLSELREPIDEQLMQIASSPSNSSKGEEAKPPPPTSSELLAAMAEDVKKEADELLEDEELLQRIVDDAEALGVAGEDRLVQAIYMIGTSRELARPMAGIIQGPSSSGKSHVLAKVGMLFPDETILRATELSPKCLYYLPPGSLRHRFVLCGERSRRDDDEIAEATRALREIISEGRLCKPVPVKSDGKMETVMLEQEGPIAYLESTTQSRIFEEDRNRCLLLSTDETPEQTERILRAAASGYAGHRRLREQERIVLRHHAVQRMVGRREVIVPYAEGLASVFHCGRVEARRAYPLLMGAVQACALLHQRMRERDDEGRVIASREDYVAVRHLFGEAVERSLGLVLSGPARRFLERLRHRTDLANTFTAETVIKGDESNKSAVYGWLHELRAFGLVEVVDPGGGRQAATLRFTSAAYTNDPQPAPMLPTADELFSVPERKHGSGTADWQGPERAGTGAGGEFVSMFPYGSEENK